MEKGYVFMSRESQANKRPILLVLLFVEKYYNVYVHETVYKIATEIDIFTLCWKLISAEQKVSAFTETDLSSQ